MSKWIVKHPGVLGGRPYIRGTRLAVDELRCQMAAGVTKKDIMRAYPQVTEEAIEAARLYIPQVLDKGVLRPQNFRRMVRPSKLTGPIVGGDTYSGDS